LVGIASGGGLSARTTAERFKFAFCSTDPREVLDNPAINTVAILTRHHLHARQTIAALEAGKHVFVEKPLCVSEEELHAIIAAVAQAAEHPSNNGQPPSVMVGFNRRFAPFVQELKQHLSRINEPVMVQYRINAGYIPLEHWVHDPSQGGGRLIGEGCHFIDLTNFLIGKSLRQVRTRALPDNGRYAQDNLSIELEYGDGSLGSIVYVANGDKGFGKEALEVFGGGLAARLDDYRSLQIRHGHTRINRVARLRQDKGHRGEWQRLVAYLTGSGPQPIPFAEIVNSMRATFAAQRSLDQGEPVRLSEGE
jgi:predicted dehydrogenase